MTEMNQDKLTALNVDELECVTGGSLPRYNANDTPEMKIFMMKREIGWDIHARYAVRKLISPRIAWSG